MQTVERLGITPYSQGKIHGLEVLGISSTEVAGRALRGTVYRLVILPEEIDAQHVIHSTTPITLPQTVELELPHPQARTIALGGHLPSFSNGDAVTRSSLRERLRQDTYPPIPAKQLIGG
jgi:hypothetical protein